jgi:hypothetical protein
MNDFALYNLIYFLFSFFLIYPPQEIQSFGLSLPTLLAPLLGSEQLCFVHYHMVRICLTILIHSLLPLGYYLFIGFNLSELNLFSLGHVNVFWQAYLSFSILFAIGLITLVYYWSLNDYVNHPIAVKLRNLASSRSDLAWKEVANEINREFRNIDKFSTGSLFNRIYLTDNWLVKVNLYTLSVSNHHNTELVLTHSTELELSIHSTTPSTQFLNILVKPNDVRFSPFYIRLNSLEYKDFTDKLQQPVRHACDVIIKQSLPDQFLDSFRRQVTANAKFQARRDVTKPFLLLKSTLRPRITKYPATCQYPD